MNQAPAAEKIFIQAVKRRQSIPKALYDGPQVHPWLGVFFEAYLDLMSDRHWEWGLIPWVARQRWAETHGLDRLATDLLHTHIKAMDVAYLEWRQSKLPKGGKSRPLPDKE